MKSELNEEMNGHNNAEIISTAKPAYSCNISSVGNFIHRNLQWKEYHYKGNGKLKDLIKIPHIYTECHVMCLVCITGSMTG